MPRLKFFLLFFIFILLFSFAWTEWNFSKTAFVKIGSTSTWKDSLNNTVFFISGMDIDADGSPHAYHPVPDSGLDRLANAGKKGNWWGIVTEKEEPVVQDKDDPAPGYYISCTSLQDATKKVSDVNRYVNAETIPYVVLPNNKTFLATLRTGDIGFVKNLRNGKSVFVICADVGPADQIGEGSIHLADSLGIPSSPRTGGVSDSVLYVLFPGSGTGKPLPVQAIDSIGKLHWRKEMETKYAE